MTSNERIGKATVEEINIAFESVAPLLAEPPYFELPLPNSDAISSETTAALTESDIITFEIVTPSLDVVSKIGSEAVLPMVKKAEPQPVCELPLPQNAMMFDQAL